MLKLNCAVVGKEAFVSVNIGDDQEVGDVKDQIAEKKMYRDFPASRLELYFAKQGDGAWLKLSDRAVVQLQKATTIPDALVHKHLNKGFRLHSVRRLHHFFDPNALNGDDGAIHVLVHVPNRSPCATSGAAQERIEKKRKVTQDTALQELWERSALQRTALPEPHALVALLQRPRPVPAGLDARGGGRWEAPGSIGRAANCVRATGGTHERHLARDSPDAA